MRPGWHDQVMRDVRELLRGLPVFGGDLPVFDPVAVPERPEELFVAWLAGAIDAGVREPHVMTLSTQGLDDAPDARVLMLRDVTADGWRFATHRLSPKGRQLDRLPAAALTFFWGEQGRQVRVRGRVSPAPEQESAADFLHRSPATRAEAMTGRQSEILTSRHELERAAEAAIERIDQGPDLVLDGWTLYTLHAGEVEFWQAARDRQHTRLRYRRDGDTWTRGELWP